MNAKRIVLATAAASLFLAGPALAADNESGDDQVKCEGANACKGQSACSTAESSCAGKNACKGKGFLMMTEAECDEALGADEEDTEG